jgi:hypothetical protein
MTTVNTEKSSPDAAPIEEKSPLLQRFAEAFRVWANSDGETIGEMDAELNCWRLLDEYEALEKASVEELVKLQPMREAFEKNAMQVLSADRDEWKARAMKDTQLPNGWPVPDFMYTAADGSLNVEWIKGATTISFSWVPDEGAMVVQTGPDGDITDEGLDLARKLDEWLKPKGRDDVQG